MADNCIETEIKIDLERWETRYDEQKSLVIAAQDMTLELFSSNV